MPKNYLHQTEMTIGASGESARTVLIKMIDGLHWRDKNIRVPMSHLTWRVLYSPDGVNSLFMINMELARKEIDAPGGGQVVVPIR